MEITQNIKDIEQKENYYQINTNNSSIRLYFMTDDIIRIRASFDKSFKEESYSLVTTAWDDRLDDLFKNERKRINTIPVDFKESKNNYTFKTKTLSLKFNKKPYFLEVYNNNDELIYSDIPKRAYVKDNNNLIYHYTKRKPNDIYYGFGETTGKINKAGRHLKMSPKDALGYNPKSSDPLYKQIPFYIKLDAKGKNALGLFYNNTWKSSFNMGQEHSNYWPHYSSFCATGGDIDLFLINGPKMSNVVTNYCVLTGTSSFMPKYSLGYLGSTMYYVELPKDCDDEIIGFVDKTISEDIPVDGFQLSSGYTVGGDGLRYTFWWNNTRFKNPKKFFCDMQSRGVETSPNIKPGILTSHPYYNEFANDNAFLECDKKNNNPYIGAWWGGLGSFVDFTSKNGRNIWKNFIIEKLVKNNVSSIWNDNCEFDLESDDAICDFDGKKTSIGELKSIMPNMMSYVSHQALQECKPNIRPYVICRSGFAGIQRYAQTWCGDNPTSWSTLKYNIATILGLGLSGVANQGADVGGFQGPHPEEELLVRWVQNGIFQPRFSIHSCNTDNTVTEPWMYKNSTKYIRDAIKFRYTLIPYFYSLLWEAHKKGSPIMRAMVYEFQDDTKCLEESVDFMLGSSLLVANVVKKGSKSRTIYLPKSSNWYDFYTHDFYEGGQEITIPVEISTIPLLIREGGIIPKTPDLKNINKDKMENLELIIAYSKKSSEFNLYEDDGKTNEYKNNNFLETKITTSGGDQFEINFKHNGSYKSTIKTATIELINCSRGAYYVELEGQKIPQIINHDAWKKANIGWCYDASSKATLIKYPYTNKDQSLLVSFEPFDLIGMDSK